MTTRGLRIGALGIAASGLFHLAALAFAGLTTMGVTFVIFGLIYLFVAWYLLQGWRWLAYIAFLWSLIGFCGALFASFNPDPLPAWLYMAVVIANLICFLGLFGYLWGAKPEKEYLQNGA